MTSRHEQYKLYKLTVVQRLLLLPGCDLYTGVQPTNIDGGLSLQQCRNLGTMARVCVVLGSVREGRMGLRVANMIIKQLTSLGAEPVLLDPLVINPPMLQQPLHFMKVT